MNPAGGKGVCSTGGDAARRDFAVRSAGAGKTTTAGKLALKLRTEQKKVLLVPCERAARRRPSNQTLAGQVELDFTRQTHR